MLIDGRKIAKKMELQIIKKLKNTKRKRVCFLIFKKNLAIKKFVEMKTKVGKRLNIICDTKELKVKTNKEALESIDKILKENYDGIIIQLPLPKYLKQDVILNNIPVNLDIDVLNSLSLDLYLKNKNKNTPPIAKAIEKIFKDIKVDLKNKNILIVGNGKLVGQMAAKYFEKKKINFDIITEKTEEKIYKKKFKNADIIISGVGKPGFIKGNMIKTGVTIIDAGTSEQNGKLAGDADISCYKKASFITPVPGGIGPVVVMSLFDNLK